MGCCIPQGLIVEVVKEQIKEAMAGALTAGIPQIPGINPHNLTNPLGDLSNPLGSAPAVKAPEFSVASIF